MASPPNGPHGAKIIMQIAEVPARYKDCNEKCKNKSWPEVLEEEAYSTVLDGSYYICSYDGKQYMMNETTGKGRQLVGRGWEYEPTQEFFDVDELLCYCHNPYSSESVWCGDASTDCCFLY